MEEILSYLNGNRIETEQKQKEEEVNGTIER